QAKHREYGKAEINVGTNATLFRNLPEQQVVWMSHGDLVTEVPDGFSIAAKSPSCPITAMSNEVEKLYGVQFHPEVRHSVYGNDILKNFVFNVCGCEANWTMEHFIDVQIEQIRKTVGDKKVLCALSGGVDSSVVAVLIHKAIGDQLTCMFVDHGLLRKGEAESVMETFAEKFHMNVI